MPADSGVTVRVLVGERAEMDELQRVIEDAPAYAQSITGVPPGPADAQSLYSVLPDGKSYDDKFVLGIYRGIDLVGCADLIRGFPGPDTAHLGLLLIAERFQRRGYGEAAYRELKRLVRSWNTCSRMRLGVVRTNARVLPFWSRLGFEPTGEVKPYRYGAVVSEIVILKKPLSATTAA